MMIIWYNTFIDIAISIKLHMKGMMSMRLRKAIATSLVVISTLATVVPLGGHSEIAQITAAVTQTNITAEAKEVIKKESKVKTVESISYPTISAEENKLGITKFTTTTVNLRKESNTTSTIIQTLNPNTQVEEKYTYKDWSCVYLNSTGVYGFIKSEYLSKKKTPISELNRWGIELSRKEIDLLAKVVFRESNLEPYKGQVAVVETIFNRMIDGYWGDSLYDVLSSPGQFTCWNTVSTAEPTAKNYKAITDVLNGKTNVLGMDYLYFSRGGHKSHGCKVIGDHQFCKK